MPRVPTVRKADLDRALKALADAGFTVAAVEVRPGGQVVITPVPSAASTPNLTSGQIEGQPPSTLEAQPQDLDAWRDRKRGHRAAERS